MGELVFGHTQISYVTRPDRSEEVRNVWTLPVLWQRSVKAPRQCPPHVLRSPWGSSHPVLLQQREREVGKAGSGAVCEPQIVRTLRKWGVVGLTHTFPGRRALGISHELGIWEPISFSHVLHALNDFFIQSIGTPKVFTTCTVIYTSKDEWIQCRKHYSAWHKYSPQLIMWRLMTTCCTRINVGVS